MSLLFFLSGFLFNVSVDASMTYIFKDKISYFYMLISSCLLGSFYVIILNVTHSQFTLMYLLIFFTLIMPAFTTDYRYLYISPRYLLFIFVMFTALKMYDTTISWVNALTGLFLGFLLIQIIILLSKGGMGVGDSYLLALFGYVFGIKYMLISFVFAIIIGGVFVIFYILKSRAHKNQMLPFGPFLIIGVFLSVLIGDKFLNYYLILYQF